MADYNSIYTGEEIDRRLTDVDNRIALPSPAYAGLFPRGNAQGQVDWVPHGQPTDAQTAAAVTAWLNAHPEATTTVQDGSLTKQKFAPGLVGGANGIAALDGSGKVPDGQLPLPWTAAKTYAAGAYCEHNGYLWHNTSGAASTGVEPGKNYNVWNVTYSNPNLLDNWYFGNPVNQRGNAVYERTGGAFESGYCLDRWSFTTWNVTSASVAKTDGGVILAETASGSATGSLTQKLEPSLVAGLRGKTVTLSIRYTIRSSGFSPRIFVNGSSKLLSSDKHAEALTVTVPTDAESITVEIGQYGSTGGGGNFDMTIHSAKLELGSVSTLANDTAPNYAEELAKCQRYLRPYLLNSWNDINLKVDLARGGTRIFSFLDFTGNPMRTRPSMLCYAGGNVRIVGETSSGTTIVATCAASDFYVHAGISSPDGAYVVAVNEVISGASPIDPAYAPVTIDAFGSTARLFLTAEL